MCEANNLCAPELTMSVAVDLCATAVLGTLIGVVWWYLKHWWMELHIGTYLPPGPRPVPILGNAHQLGLDGQHKVFAKWRKTYGEYSMILMRQYCRDDGPQEM